jgi:hypothetical protein
MNEGNVMKNKVQFQKGYSLCEFMKNYGTGLKSSVEKPCFSGAGLKGMFALSAEGKATAP